MVPLQTQVEELGHVLRQVSSGPAAELRRRALVVAGVRTTRAMRRCIGAPVGPARAAALEHERGAEDGEEYDLGASAEDTWLDPTVHYRGAPCLLNLLLARHGQACFVTEDLDRLMKATGGAELEKVDLGMVLRVLLHWCHIRSPPAEQRAESGVLVALADSLKAALGKRGLRHTVDVRRLHGLPPAAAATPTTNGCTTISRLHSTLAAEGHTEDSLWSAEVVDMLAGLARLELVGEVAGEGGGGGVLFTAPHGLSLRREGFTHHKPEDYTTRLAKSFAQALGSSAVVWAEGERCKSELLKLPDRFNADPNYLTRSQLVYSPWNATLSYYEAAAREAGAKPPEGASAVCAGRRLHVDVHGRRDYAAGLDVDNSDCDIGTAALEHYEGTVGADGQVVWVTGRPYSDRGKSPRVYPPGLSRRLGGLIAEGLTDLFQRWRPLGTDVEFRVNQDPKLSGFTVGSNRFTLSRQGVEMGLISVQLELTRRLRKALADDDKAQVHFAMALESAWSTCRADFDL